MKNLLKTIIDAGDYALHVKRWPVRYRRIWLLLFPLTGPLWLLAFGATMAFVGALVVVLFPVLLFFDYAVPLWRDDKDREERG